MSVMVKSAREAVILIDQKVYAEEAVQLASLIFSAKADCFVEEGLRGRRKVVLQAKENASAQGLRRVAGEFLNEVLNQDLRLQLLRDNSRIIQLMTAQALAAAKSLPPTPVEPEIERNLREEAERLIAEEKAAS